MTADAVIQAILNDNPNPEWATEDAEAGQLSLGELISKLQAHDGSKRVLIQVTPGEFGNWGNPGDIDSYRGYYSDAMLETDGLRTPVTVRELEVRLQEAVYDWFTGYKGGDYFFTANTPVWADTYGDCKGHMVTGVHEAGGIVYITTTQEV